MRSRHGVAPHSFPPSFSLSVASGAPLCRNSISECSSSGTLQRAPVRLIRKLLVALLTLAAIAGLYPVSYSVCPTWNVTVLDETGTPLAGMTVRRSCNDYSAGIHREEDRRTDQHGRASFHAQRVRVPTLIRWAGNVSNVVTQGVHASFGCYSYVFAFGAGRQGSPVRDGYVEAWRGSPEHMESRIVAVPVVGLDK